VKRAATPKLGAYAGLAALGLLAGLVLGRPEVVALAAPFAIFLCLGLIASARPEIEVRVTLARDRALEGDAIGVGVELYSEAPVAEVEVALDVPPGLIATEREHRVAVRLEADEPVLVELDLQADHWGAYFLGEVAIRARDAFGLFLHEQELDLRRPLKVYPRAELLREVVRPLETQVFSGNQVARVKGEGIEFADLRQYVPGDRVRRINWRASARRAELWVNEHHPERNADVVVFLDSFAEARRDAAAGGTLDQSVRAAAALLAGYAGQRDRVGFVSFGGIVRWLRPASGLNQLYRVVDALLDTEITLNYAWKGIDLIPPGVLPPQALVIALTPLLDDRSATALLDLRARGFDLAVVDVSPIPYADAGTQEIEQLSFRLWKLRRQVLRARYERVGVAIVEWDVEKPLVSALEEVSAFRRRVRSG
jgi:uncharacterized protein (DUF58 family)